MNEEYGILHLLNIDYVDSQIGSFISIILLLVVGRNDRVWKRIHIANARRS